MIHNFERMVNTFYFFCFVFVILASNVAGFMCAIVSIKQTQHLFSIEATQLGIVSICMHVVSMSAAGILLFWLGCYGVRVSETYDTVHKEYLSSVT